MSSASSADAETEEQRKRPPVHPLSKATSRRFLREMLQRAEHGDNGSSQGRST